MSILIARSLSQSRFIVQDLSEVVCIARQNIAKTAPSAARQGRITAEVVDLFDIQPRRGDDLVYLLRITLCVSLSDDWCSETNDR